MTLPVHPCPAAAAATADRRIDDVNILGLAAHSASSTAVSGSDRRVDRDDRAGLGVRRQLRPTTSRTCASLSTVTLMMSAVCDVGHAVGQRRTRVRPAASSHRRGRRRRSRPPGQTDSTAALGHRRTPVAAQPDVTDLQRQRRAHDRMICPPSTLKIWPVIHLA